MSDKTEAMYVYPSFCTQTIYMPCETYMPNHLSVTLYMGSIDFLFVYIFFLFILTYLLSLSHMKHFMSPFLCFPQYFHGIHLFCVVFLLACMHVCACVCVCALGHVVHADGAPEEEGRPRRRRTPRFLLKPWPQSTQATDSRLSSLQVKRMSTEN